MILCCGDVLIDMLPVDLGDGRRTFAPHAGGAVFNTAIALGRLGVETGFFNGLSTDLFGKMLADELKASGVDHSLCPRSGRPTTLAFVTLEDGHAHYHFYDEATASRLLESAELPVLDGNVRALFFGGISLVVEPSGSAFEKLMARGSATRLVMIDPNIRPDFVTDETAYRARLTRMMAGADIVKLSEEDLDWLSPDADAFIAELLVTGPAIVLVTHGARGATGHTASEAISVSPRPTTIVDTVGAGDAFNAGFLEALEGLGRLDKAGTRSMSAGDLRICLDRAAEVAAVAVSRPGANPPWAPDISEPAWQRLAARA
ncbi:carbohydrate kinase [Aliihoeflea sp. 40Bstr573]|uniref:carbohydrate kinase family protein n=1 Tax=Aliihoeflea sp. 40Bstr573 TaxID=2696467 RepID=UPI002095FED9|nr:carbohydrate kinase [Aliihoeflea sp. 40Bstr573]MCO6386646.1 carbohydrate kinase [Aliihoeflea sp. 40Bstr573]